MAKIKNPTHPVAKIVEPLRQSAMDNAEKYVREDVAKAYAELAANGWRIDVVAPRVSSWDRDGSEKHRFYTTITKNADGSYSANRSLVVAHPEGVEYLVKTARRDAEDSFIGYVNKLVAKIGDDVTGGCELRGIDKTNLWAQSELTVTRTDGSTEKWLTQQIWNRSILGNRFPQWPTRQTAGAKRATVAKVQLVHAQRDGRYAKLCSHPISRTAHAGVISADVSKVTCPRCLERLGALKVAAGGAS